MRLLKTADATCAMAAGDVYRAPPYLVLFAACIGTGTQLISLMFLLVSFTFITTYLDECVLRRARALCRHVKLTGCFVWCGCGVVLCDISHYLHQRGTVLNSIVAVYCLTALIGGAVSGSVYKKNSQSEEWKLSTQHSFLPAFPAVQHSPLVL